MTSYYRTSYWTTEPVNEFPYSLATYNQALEYLLSMPELVRIVETLKDDKSAVVTWANLERCKR